MPAIAKKRKFDLKKLTPEQRKLIRHDWPEPDKKKEELLKKMLQKRVFSSSEGIFDVEN